MKYLKDWRIWLLALVVVIIVENPITSWAGEVDTKEYHQTIEDIQFEIVDINFKWKFNKIQAEYNLSETMNLKMDLSTDTSLNSKAVLTFDITW